ncbi:hypothetical protein MYM_0558 [Mesomycoplasma hyorhinis GDL-1]|uniref:Uncharacterized protein n=1 Tax=Mesomycoplasma hyorhinis (strain MCLD) TaxID=936139 RepID=A0ABM5M6A6_MESHM|nr:hypothetical protein SRH_03195 [Mesomycoplasma hyorhinis MCLD]AEX14305.1 hypothetical protein MYM_0558 [Mesomycoplasma hyorhinis GDL-1]
MYSPFGLIGSTTYRSRILLINVGNYYNIKIEFFSTKL